MRLSKSLHAWGTPSFADAFKSEIKSSRPEDLPLQAGLTAGSVALTDTMEVMIISAAEREHAVTVRAGIFYTGIRGGCSCANDPTPVEETPEYCEAQFDIDKVTAETKVVLP